MRFWRRLKGAWFWVKALEAERNDQFEEALKLVEKSEELFPPKPSHCAFKAMLLVRTGDPEKAHKIFADVRQSLKSKEDADSRYIRRYVQSWLATLRTDPFQANYEHREAAKINCRPALKRWLWMPGEPPRDPHDSEFDAWMKAHCPEELRQR